MPRYAYATPTFIIEVLCFVTTIQLLKHGITIHSLIRLVSFMMHFITKVTAFTELHHYVSKCSKLTQLDYTSSVSCECLL